MQRLRQILSLGDPSLRWADYVLLAVLFVLTHFGAFFILMYIGDDHMVLDASFNGLMSMYNMYGRPELPYTLSVSRLLYGISPVILRLVTTLFPIITIYIFYTFILEEMQDRVAAIVASTAFAVGFVWISNLYIIIFPYVYSITLLIWYAIICQRVISQRELRWNDLLGLIIIGALGVSYEPLVVFLPLTLFSILLNRKLKPQEALRDKSIRTLFLITAGIFLFQAAWFVATPAWGFYENVNSIKRDALFTTLADLPWHLAAFARAYVFSHFTHMGQDDEILVLGGLLIALAFGIPLRAQWRFLGGERRRRLRYGLAIILYAIAFIALSLLPFIVAGKVTLAGYGVFRDPFGARHYYLASIGVAIMLAGLMVFARGLGRGPLVVALVIVTMFLSFGVRRQVLIYDSAATRSDVTMRVVAAALRNPDIQAAETVIIRKSARVGKGAMILWGWWGWGPGYLWRELGGSPDKLFLTDTLRSTIGFVNKYIEQGSWYGFPHLPNEKGDPLCLQAVVDRWPTNAERRRGFWRFNFDREAYVRMAGDGVTFEKAPCS